MSLISPLNVSVQTFWSKYKVLIFGAVSAVVAALSPLIEGSGQSYDVKALVVAAIIAGATFLGKEARGKNWTIFGQVCAALIAIASAYSNSFDLVKIVLAAIAAYMSIPISPIKPSTYEHAPTIVEAKKEAEEILTIRKSTPLK